MMKKLVALLFCVIIMFGCNDPNNTISQEAKYSIFYNGNSNTSGSVPIDNNHYLSGEEAVVLGKGSLEKTGFEFINWNANQQGSGTSYNNGDKIKIGSSNVILYAVWNELGKYTVTFETFGGSTVQTITNVTFGIKINKPTNPTKINSAFEGWFIDEDFEIEWNFQNNIVENNLTLYAKWRNTLYDYEATNIYHLKVGIYLMVYWTNPIDENFDHVRVILSGFEWAESMGGTDQDPGKTSYSAADFAGTEYVIIKCVGKDGTVSEGVKYYLSNVANPIVSDFNIIGLGAYPYDGNIKTVTITPKENKSTGEITVYYNGSTIAPVAVGTYVVTFDVAAITGFNAVTGLVAGTLVINPNPVAGDFNISGLGTYPYDKNPKTVTITPKTGSSQGTITVYYNGNTTVPIAVGTYTVTFDVAAITDFNAATGLSAGILIINAPQDPIANDFNINGFGTYTYNGNPKAVTIMPKAGSSQGEITIYYNGSTTIPIVVGTYTVTFDVAATTGFNAAIGLSAGILTIAPPYTFIVNNLSDGIGSETTVGTLRYAITNAQDGEIISFSGIEPGNNTVMLTSALPMINKSISIEGNGVTITRDSSWIDVSNISQFLYVQDINPRPTVNVSRIHFKNGMTNSNGVASNGAAIHNWGNLTLESCIFSDNWAYGSTGGAIFNGRNMNIKGCTFYNNSANDGGAIRHANGTLTLTGNLFYKNSAQHYPIVWRSSGIVTSLGYNVIDRVPGYIWGADWDATTGDAILDELGISGIPINTSTFEPVVSLRSVIPNVTLLDFPITDFNGEVRIWPGAPGAVK